MPWRLANALILPFAVSNRTTSLSSNTALNDYDEDSVIGHQCGRKLVASQAPNNHSATMAAKPATIAKTMRKFDTCVSSPPVAEENQSFFEGDQRRRACTFGGSHSKAASHATTSGFAFVPHTMKALGHHCLGMSNWGAS
jgi:hypothetical protein